MVRVVRGSIGVFSWNGGGESIGLVRGNVEKGGYLKRREVVWEPIVGVVVNLKGGA